MKITFSKYILKFKQASGTSRGVLLEKKSWFIHLLDTSETIIGRGECSIIEGLSPDYSDESQYENLLEKLVQYLKRFDLEQLVALIQNKEQIPLWLIESPSIFMGLEMAVLDAINGGKGCYFNNDFYHFSKRIPINGLVWMGSKKFMFEQIKEKINQGFKVIKMKIGAIDFQSERELLKYVRSEFSENDIQLRVDANGAFSFDKAKEVIKILTDYHVHSIEQPIKPGKWNEMGELCAMNETPVALDEELIGIHEVKIKTELLNTIKAPYIILKPSLHGGFLGSKEWIESAERQNISWWMTSALESNIGLSAICQFTAEFHNLLPQGLGTGSLYVNNIESRLKVENGFISM